MVDPNARCYENQLERGAGLRTYPAQNRNNIYAFHAEKFGGGGRFHLRWQGGRPGASGDCLGL